MFEDCFYYATVNLPNFGAQTCLIGAMGMPEFVELVREQSRADREVSPPSIYNLVQISESQFDDLLEDFRNDFVFDGRM